LTLFDPDTAVPSPGDVAGPTVRVRMTVAYDGRGFHGFAPNPGVKTVGGTLRTSIERVLGHPIFLTCAGRTDTGVHGWGQVVSFDAREEGLDLPELQRSLNKLCGPQVVVREAAVAAPDFDARRSATGRSYRYTVLNRPVPDPFLARFAWHVETPLDIGALRLACDPLIGEHDFSSFCRRPRVPDGAAEPGMVRRVFDACWHDLGDGVLRFDIAASAFCQQMVRSIVGTLVAAGSGRKRAGDVRGILEARDRRLAGDLAPPHGLVLWDVRY
jgi:tRNA pseudouridine38-40 synthase